MNTYVLSTGRNANKFIVDCIESVKNQTFLPTKHIIIDNNSNDETKKFLSLYKEDQNLQIIRNKERKYKTENFYEIITKLQNEDIIIVLDNDDKLDNKMAIEKVYKIYQEDNNIEFVYSNFKFSHGVLGNNMAIPSNNWNPYDGAWITSHLTTFKAKRFKKINKLNFLGNNQEWIKMACDQAVVLPLLYSIWQECGNYSKVKFINEILYYYNFYGNESKPRDANTEDAQLAMKYSQLIRNRGFIK